MIDKTKLDEWLSKAITLLDYNQDTGVFTWKRTQGRQAKGTVAGTKNSDGYIYVRVNGLSLLAHRAAFAFCFGRWPESYIDHINGNKQDNRIWNLREATPQANVANSKKRKDNTSGFKGVRKAKSKGRWCANIYVNGKIVYIGTYDTPELAHEAYMDAAKQHFGDFARAS